MHNCRRTQAKLTELLFDELPAEESSRRRAEIEACNECARQYHSLTATLALFDEAANAAPPKSESYWLAYNNRLRDQLNNPYAHQLQLPSGVKRVSFWRRAFLMRVQIPVPALAVIALAVGASFFSLLMLRPAARDDNSLKDARAATSTASLNGSNHPSFETPARIIEVPVVQEKIVTRIVYVNRKPQEEERRAMRRNTQSETFEPGEQELARAALQLPPAPLARTSLAGFQPTNEVKLTVIKASEEHKQ